MCSVQSLVYCLLQGSAMGIGALSLTALRTCKLDTAKLKLTGSHGNRLQQVSLTLSLSLSVCVCMCVCVCVCMRIHTTAPCSSALRDLLRQSLAAPAHSLRLLFGSGAMQAAGIEPAPSRHEPGDSTTDTAPTTIHHMHTATVGTPHGYPDRPCGLRGC